MKAEMILVKRPIVRMVMMPNTELNACLAEWMGWKYDGAFWISPDNVGSRISSNYDTDPDAALELLGWLITAPRTWRADIGSRENESIVILLRGYEPWQLSARATGPPLIALPAAIAEVARQVLDLEEKEHEEQGPNPKTRG